MRLYSSVIKLINRYPVTLTYTGGQHAHGAFFHIIEQVDPELSARLHEIEGKGARKPFTVSPLMGLPRNSHHKGHEEHKGKKEKGFVNSVRSAVKNEIHLREGWECWLRVTMLDEGLFKTFLERFHHPNDKGLPEVRLGDAHFWVSEILTTPGSHPWTGYTTLEELQKRLDEPAPPSITFAFYSPVSFSLGKPQGAQKNIYESTPYPRLVFGNLATAWKALTGEDMVKAVENYAEQNLRLILHRVEQRAVTMRDHPEKGSAGRVEYQFTSTEDTPPARALNLLADLAFYTGIGRKTAQGMGMARRV